LVHVLFPNPNREEITTMLWTLLLVLLIMWALGLGFGVAGNLIHLVLVVALVLLVVQLLSGRKVV
jgi:hypothetical protein